MADTIVSSAAHRRGFAEILALSPVKEHFEEVDAAYKEEYPGVDDETDNAKPKHERT